MVDLVKIGNLKKIHESRGTVKNYLGYNYILQDHAEGLQSTHGAPLY
jgi:hypothetical protein